MQEEKKEEMTEGKEEMTPKKEEIPLRERDITKMTAKEIVEAVGGVEWDGVEVNGEEPEEIIEVRSWDDV